MGTISARKALLACGTAIAIATAATPAFAQQRTFNLPAQSATRSIPEFARQAGIQIVAPGSLLRSLQTPTIRGTYDVRAALRQLIEGTGLRIVSDEGGTITLGAATGTPGSGEAEAGGAAADSGSAAEIVVTGTRIRGASSTAPSITISREELANAGYSRLEDVFEDLPQNFGNISPDGRFANEGGSRLGQLNNERATAIDLRGLGPQSTLTLVNGTRRAGSVQGRVTDISSIPLSAIERIEIVTGGRSAVYGSDAVAGVVNFITRRSFEGVEASIGYDDSVHPGGQRLNAGLTTGIRRDNFGIVMGYDYTKYWPLDLADSGLLTLEPAGSGNATQLNLVAQASTRRHSGFLASRIEPLSGVELYFDGFYTWRRNSNVDISRSINAPEDSTNFTLTTTEQYSGTVGTRIDLPAGWKADAYAHSSVADTPRLFRQNSFSGSLRLVSDTIESNRATLRTFSAVADGPLFSVAGIIPRAAIGAEVRNESVDTVNDNTSQVGAGTPTRLVRPFSGHRTVRSVFGEIQIPLISGNAMEGEGLEITAAARYDDYSDFGDTFNPQAGIVWSPIRGLRLRGSYSSAFRAPSLIELGTRTTGLIQNVPDPSRGGAPTPVLFILGDNPNLEPEEAKTWTIGLDYQPRFAPWARLSVSYFNIDYENRLEVALLSSQRPLLLQRENLFPGLIDRSPTSAEAAALLDLTQPPFVNNTGTPFNPATQGILAVFPNLVTFDNRTNNIAVETVSGLDLQATANIEVGRSTLTFGVNATYTIDHDRNVTPQSPSFSLLNEVGKPVDFRLRANAGWTHGPFGAFVYMNYADDYTNPFSAPPGSMDSWTTFDVTLRFRGGALGTGGFGRGFSANLSVQNLFNRAPPEFPNSLTGVRYDATNASPLGRVISVRLTKRW
jgi:iron complex outermembrane receptor protein